VPRFAQVHGQEAATRLLRRLIQRNRLPHAVLLVGRPGCGRRTVALACAQALLCGRAAGGDACGACDDCRLVAQGIHPDLVALPGEGETPGQDLLDLYHREEGREAGGEIQAGLLIPAAWTRIVVAAAAAESPLRGRGRVFILPAIERLGGTAANALLKVLEEPPAGCTFLMTCAHLGAVLPTIRSRSQAYRLADLDRTAVEEILQERGLDPHTARRSAATSRGSHHISDEDGEASPLELLRGLLADGGLHAGRLAELAAQLPAGQGGDASARRRAALRRWLDALTADLQNSLRSDDPSAALTNLDRVAGASRLLDRHHDPRVVLERLALA
jgi:hypothetical protein